MKGYLLFAGLLVMAFPATAGTVLSTVDPRAYNGYIPFGAMELAWSQTSTFSDVAIAVALSPFSVSGTAYLMSQVGPGTTQASELLSAPFSVTGSTFILPPVTLFSGLTLGPGTYHLVLTGDHGTGGEGGWSLFDTTLGGTVITAPGVTLVEGAAWDPTPAAYPPASDFVFRYFHGLAWAVDVTGTPAAAVPEPSTQLFMLSGLVLLVARLKLMPLSH